VTNRNLAVSGAVPRSIGGSPLHPYASDSYRNALDAGGATTLEVPPWDSYVVLPGSQKKTGFVSATGPFPLASLDPNCDLRGGLSHLQSQGVSTVAIVTDPLWAPTVTELEAAFDTCRVFKSNFVIDMSLGKPRLRKRHRNRINNAKRCCETHIVSLSEYLDTWWSLYRVLVDRHEMSQAFSKDYFKSLANMSQLTAIAAFVKDEIVSMSLWVRFEDIAYFHDGASTDVGYNIFAAYATHDCALSHFQDCRYINLGAPVGFVDTSSSGLAEFKRGFCNTNIMNYFCSANLRAQK
jgi:hypothetical protein